MDPASSFFATVAVLFFLGFVFVRLLKGREEDAARQRKAAVSAVIPRVKNATPREEFSAFEMQPGVTYRVVKAFVDHDRETHEVGERWVFLGKAFLPYEDGLSLFVERDGRQVHIRMQCRNEEQGPVVNSFSDYVVEE